MILYLVDSIIQLQEKQKKRFSRTSSQRSTLKNYKVEKQKDCIEKMGSHKFIIAIDNYFTQSKVIFALRELDIGIVETAKYQK